MLIKRKLKLFFIKKRKLYRKIYFLWGGNRVTGKRRNEIIYSQAFMKKCHIIIEGINNKLYIDQDAILSAVSINVRGNNNTIHLANNTIINGGEFYIEDDYNRIEVGEKTTMSGKVRLSCAEGTSIIIGNDCMFSANIEIRTCDAHSVMDAEGKRTNASKNVKIGDHCWIGNTVFILKGTEIQAQSIVGAGSVVTKKFGDIGCVIAGNPARIIRKKVNWERKRI